MSVTRTACVCVGVCVCVCVAVTCTVCATVTGTVCVTVTGTVCVVCAAVNLDFKLLKFLSVTERLSTKNLTSYISEPVLSYTPLVTHDACHSLEHLQYSCQCFLSYPDATTTAVDPLSRPFSCRDTICFSSLKRWSSVITFFPARLA